MIRQEPAVPADICTIMKICIIGGGLTGLTAAYALSGRHDIDLFEKTSAPGGCLSSYQVGNYWIEKYYHHCFSGDKALISLFDKSGPQRQA